MILSYGKEVIAVCQGLRLEEGDAFDEAYRRFKKQTDRNLVVTECRAKEGSLSLRLKNAKNKKSALKRSVLKRLYMLRRYESRL